MPISINATMTQAMSMSDELKHKHKDMLVLYNRVNFDIVYLMSREA